MPAKTMWVYSKRLGGTKKRWVNVCGILENMVRVASAALGVEAPFARLTLGMIRADGSGKPRMKLKAAEGRSFLPVLLKMMRNLFETDAEHELRCQCLEAMVKIYAELDQWEHGASTLRLASLARRHVALFGELRALQTSEDFWAFTPKHHLLIHVCESSTANPKLSWNYRDESEIGMCAAMARGSNQSRLCICLMQRYRTTFVLEA